jgi:hypothetical protein
LDMIWDDLHVSDKLIHTDGDRNQRRIDKGVRIVCDYFQKSTEMDRHII